MAARNLSPPLLLQVLQVQLDDDVQWETTWCYQPYSFLLRTRLQRRKSHLVSSAEFHHMTVSGNYNPRSLMNGGDIAFVLRAFALYKVNKSSRRPHTSAKENMVWIRTPEANYFQNLTRTSLSKDTSVIKFSWKSYHSLRSNALSRKSQCWRILFKNSWIRIRRRITS